MVIDNIWVRVQRVSGSWIVFGAFGKMEEERTITSPHTQQSFWELVVNPTWRKCSKRRSPREWRQSRDQSAACGPSWYDDPDHIYAAYGPSWSQLWWSWSYLLCKVIWQRRIYHDPRGGNLTISLCWGSRMSLVEYDEAAETKSFNKDDSFIVDKIWQLEDSATLKQGPSWTQLWSLPRCIAGSTDKLDISFEDNCCITGSRIRIRFNINLERHRIHTRQNRKIKIESKMGLKLQ